MLEQRVKENPVSSIFSSKHLEYSKEMNRVLGSGWHTLYDISQVCQPKPNSFCDVATVFVDRQEVVVVIYFNLVRVFNMTPMIPS